MSQTVLSQTAVGSLLTALFLVIAVVDWIAVARADKRTETVAKPGALLVLTGLGLLTGNVWLVAALLLGMLGDIALLQRTPTRFLMGLSAFLVGHLAYLVCFARLGLPGARWSWAVVVVLAAMLWATRRVVPCVHGASGAAMSAPVAIYTAVIGAMLVAAAWTGLPLIAIGAAVFVVSDSVLAVNRFIRPLPAADLTVMITYHLGQLLIVWGVLTAS